MRDSLWPPEESRAILAAANIVLFEVEGLAGNAEDYSNPDNSYINAVLESGRGIPISLSLLYCAVLQRLGVLLLPVNIPGHFLLKSVAQFYWSQSAALPQSLEPECSTAAGGSSGRSSLPRPGSPMSTASRRGSSCRTARSGRGCRTSSPRRTATRSPPACSCPSSPRHHPGGQPRRVLQAQRFRVY